jgi:hypothetical protein
MSDPLTVGWFRPGSSSRALEDSPWNWLQNQFGDLQVLDHDRLLGWLQGSARVAGSPPNVLLIGLEDRYDRMALTEIEAELAKTNAPISATSPMKKSNASKRKPADKPAAKIGRPESSQSSWGNHVPLAFLLGNDWHGHRRTSPLPDGIPTFYWYQWYDRIYPWLTEISRQATSGLWTDASSGWRIPWMLERSNWESSVLCDHRRADRCRLRFPLRVFPASHRPGDRIRTRAVSRRLARPGRIIPDLGGVDPMAIDGGRCHITSPRRATGISRLLATVAVPHRRLTKDRGRSTRHAAHRGPHLLPYGDASRQGHSRQGHSRQGHPEPWVADVVPIAVCYSE